ncbi:hypothetical protein AgCh_004268 [Apium graveolens]
MRRWIAYMAVLLLEELPQLLTSYLWMTATFSAEKIRWRPMLREKFWSNMKICHSKSAIPFSTNTSSANKTDLCEQLGVKEAQNPEKVEQKLQGWKNQVVSKARKVSWLPCPVNGYFTTDMPEELKDPIVEDLLDESKRTWDDDVLRDICSDRDYELIKHIPILVNNREDSWLWSFNDKGIFKLIGEDDVHVLFGCCFVKEVWAKVGLTDAV